MPDGFTADERDALISMLTTEIENSRLPLSPRIQRLKRIRAKLRHEELAPAESQQPRRRRQLR